MLKRKEFILGAAAGLMFATVATAGGVISWPGAEAQVASPGGTRLSAASAVPFDPPPGAPDSFADIFDKVAPAVVQIEVKTRVEGRPGGVFPFPNIPGFPFNFEQQVPQPEEGEEEELPEALGSGSGFFISPNGYIVTNNHVVANATEIKVKMNDERELTATLVGRDEATDLAVLKVEGGNFPYVDFEEAAQPRVGDWVIAVGNPFGLGGTATAGIVSARGRDIGEAYVDFIQIDAAINRGNSGGPTFDIYGRVIGVNTAIFSPSGGSVGIGFAIPADVVKSVTGQLISDGAVERGYLGVEIATLTDDQRASLGLPEDTEGAFVNTVTPGGPSDSAGLRPEDIIVAMNGEAIENNTELTRLVGAAEPGDVLRLEVIRQGRRMTVEVRSGTRPADLGDDTATSQPDDEPDAVPTPAGQVIEGLTVAPLTAPLREQFNVPAGVEGVIVIAPARVETPSGSRLNFAPGYVITRANNGPVDTVDEFRAAVAAARAAGRPGVLLSVRTPEGTVPVVLELAEAE